MGALGIVMDVVIIGALGFAIFHALRLQKQFDRMQADKKAFEALIAALNMAASRAEAAIKALKDAAGGTGDTLQQKINAARGLSEELGIVIQAGDNLAERLTVLAGKSAAAHAQESPVEELQPRTKAEKELMEAVKARRQT